LLPLPPTDIIKHANEIKNKPPTHIAINNGIKLKGGTFLATTSATAELCDNPDAPCYTMFCQPILSGALPAVTNLLFSAAIPFTVSKQQVEATTLPDLPR
jgi:hypothetical protein